MLGRVFPRHVVRIRVTPLRDLEHAVAVEAVVVTLDAVTQEKVFGAAERRGQPVRDPQELLDTIGAGLLERDRSTIAADRQEAWFLAVVCGEQRQQLEIRRWIQFLRLAQRILPAVEGIQKDDELASLEVGTGQIRRGIRMEYARAPEVAHVRGRLFVFGRFIRADQFARVQPPIVWRTKHGGKVVEKQRRPSAADPPYVLLRACQRLDDAL